MVDIWAIFAKAFGGRSRIKKARQGSKWASGLLGMVGLGEIFILIGYNVEMGGWEMDALFGAWDAPGMIS